MEDDIFLKKKLVLTADIAASLNTANFKCNECKKVFISDITLNNHVKKRHNSFSDDQVSRRVKYVNMLDSINESKSDDNLYMRRNHPKTILNCDCFNKFEKVDFSTQTDKIEDEKQIMNSETQTFNSKKDISVQHFYKGIELGVNTRQIKTASTYTQYIQEIKNIGTITEQKSEQKSIQTESNQSEKSCMINVEQDSVPFMERMTRYKHLKKICDTKELTDFTVKYYYEIKLKEIGINPEQNSLTEDETKLCTDLLEHQTSKLKQKYQNFSKIKDKIDHELNEVLKEYS